MYGHESQRTLDHQRDLFGYVCTECGCKVLEDEPDCGICNWCNFDNDMAWATAESERITAMLAASDAAVVTN